MKQKIKISMILAVLILLSLGLFAQLGVVKKEKTKPKFLRWVSEVGYWVVESNIHAPGNHVITFYTNDNILMYRETLTGVKLNPQKRTVKMKLKKALESFVITWYSQKGISAPGGDNHSFVKAVLK